jgi:F-type H+-transporting ATPase subunit epsilon
MALTIEIVTPEKKAFTGQADSVTVPTTTGEIQLLPGHIPLTTLVAAGELVVNNGGVIERLAVDKGFARILGDTVSILTEAAIDEKKIDLSAVQVAQERAEKALAAARNAPGEIDPAELEKLEQIIRFAVIQKLVKSKGPGSLSE